MSFYINTVYLIYLLQTAKHRPAHSHARDKAIAKLNAWDHGRHVYFF